MTALKHRFPVVKSNPCALTATGVPLWQPYQNSGLKGPFEVNNLAIYGAFVDQGQRGDCAGVSSTDTRFAARKLANLPVVQLSYSGQYDQARVIMGTMGQDSGETVEAMVQVYEQFGAIPESLYPETDLDFNNVPPANLWDASWKLSPGQVFHTASLADYKDAVARGCPVLVAFEVFDELEGGLVASTGWLSMPANPSNSIGGHAAVGAGCSDSVGAALIKNSWKRPWGLKQSGLDGCFFMPYEYFEKYVMDIVIFAPDNGVQPVPQPLPAPFVKPTVDTYDISVAFDREQFHVGETANVVIQVIKNGAPVPNVQGVDCQVNFGGQVISEATYSGDATGNVLHPVSFDSSGSVAAAGRWLTPYGDFLDKWATAECVEPAPAKLYRVQVGAFSSQAKAIVLEQKVKAAGFPVYLKQGDDGLFHVQVGAFASETNAQTEKGKLVAVGFTDAFIKYE